MPISVTSEEGYVLVRLADPFDSETAVELGDLLKTLPPARRVVIDFTFLRDRRLTALVSLTEECARRNGVALRGLSEFGARILEYLGNPKFLKLLHDAPPGAGGGGRTADAPAPSRGADAPKPDASVAEPGEKGPGRAVGVR